MVARKRPAAATITIDSAFQQLQQRDGPHVACEQFNKALREGRIHLWADGAEVSPSYFASHLLVVSEPAPDGGWTARMAMLRAIVPVSEWAVSGSDVNGLLKSKSELPRRRPGPVTTHDWIAISAEIAFRCRVIVPKSERRLADTMLQWCEDTYNKSPAESEMRAAVKQICDRFRRG
jgi:hypothetical protein